MTRVYQRLSRAKAKRLDVPGGTVLKSKANKHAAALRVALATLRNLADQTVVNERKQAMDVVRVSPANASEVSTGPTSASSTPTAYSVLPEHSPKSVAGTLLIGNFATHQPVANPLGNSGRLSASKSCNAADNRIAQGGIAPTYRSRCNGGSSGSTTAEELTRPPRHRRPTGPVSHPLSWSERGKLTLQERKLFQHGASWFFQHVMRYVPAQPRKSPQLGPSDNQTISRRSKRIVKAGGERRIAIRRITAIPLNFYSQC